MLALIDGDVIAHMACKSRFLAKAPPQGYSELTVLVPNKDEHKFSKEEDRKYLEESWENFQVRLQEILEAVYADDFLMAMKSPFNYRDDMYPEYKLNRHKDPSKSNQFVPVMRRLAIHEGLAIEAIGREADDMLRIWARQAEAAGDPYVIVSIDKDLDLIPGMHYNIKKKERNYITPLYAIRFLYQQLLMGDPTDNIPGVPGIGPVRAKAAVINLYEEEEMQETVVEAYMSAYEDNWYEMLLSNGKMLYLQGAEDDYFKISHWPVVQAFSDTIKHSADIGKRVYQKELAVLGVSPTLPKLGDPSPTASPVLNQSATIASSPILRPSPSPSPRLAPSRPVVEAPPCPARVSAAPSPKPFVGTTPTLRKA